MKIPKIVVTAFLLLCWTPFNANADRFNADGYEVMVNASQSSDTLNVSGRVMGGPKCSKLRLDIFAKSDKGETGHVVVNVNNAGGSGSRSFSGDDWVSKRGGSWKVISVSTSCK